MGSTLPLGLQPFGLPCFLGGRTYPLIQSSKKFWDCFVALIFLDFLAKFHCIFYSLLLLFLPLFHHGLTKTGNDWLCFHAGLILTISAREAAVTITEKNHTTAVPCPQRLKAALQVPLERWVGRKRDGNAISWLATNCTKTNCSGISWGSTFGQSELFSVLSQHDYAGHKASSLTTISSIYGARGQS